MFRLPYPKLWGLLALLAVLPNAHAELALGPMPTSLKDLPIPPVPGLLDGADPIVIDKQAAIVLGKALFWDINVGSDGMACGSCHFQAGADGRVNNQVAPGGQSQALGGQLFDNAAGGGSLGPNHALRLADFPLHQRAEPLMSDSEVLYDSDHVVGSAGTFGGELTAVPRIGTGNDSCVRGVDQTYHVGPTGTRRVTQRNAPSVINAVFNHRNFWDGRANNVFNGSSPWGDRDPNAGVWVLAGSNQVQKQRLHLINASLASLAVAPPQNTTEMGCNKRIMADVGRKLLMRQPLQSQEVHALDSVLGMYSRSTPDKLATGLNTTYRALIMKAFSPKYWSFTGSIAVNTPRGTLAFTQQEANFGLFFGLAIQLYESTLVSDQSPFDNSRRDAKFQPIDLTASELNGLKQFRKNQCALCHLGPNFSAASVAANALLAPRHPEAFGEPTFFISASNNVVNRILLMFDNKPLTAFYDTGFSSNGAVTEDNDIGAGGVDEFGNPLSYSRQYLQYLIGNNAGVLDQEVSAVRACDFQDAIATTATITNPLSSLFSAADGLRPQPQSTANCFLPAAYNAYLPTVQAALAAYNNPESRKMTAAVNGTFKTPSLRNIELTGPYMHNGGMATLRQVLEFYARGGNFEGNGKHITRVFPQPNLINSEQNIADLMAFLKTLTDDRVRYQKAPFDHPQIRVPHGHVGSELLVQGGSTYGSKLALDQYLYVPAVGANGASTPLLPFAERIQP